MKLSQTEKLIVTAKLMGSPFLIECYITNEEGKQKTEGLIQMAFAEVARLEDLMTDFRESPLTLVNQAAGKHPVKVPAELFEIINLALQISRDSDGAFDISYASVGHLWREAFKNGIPPSATELDKAKTHVNYKKIILNPQTSEVFLDDPKMKIGLGGIGKGYAVDRAYEMLFKLGCENFFVNGAGDIRVHTNQKAPRGWRVGIRNPLAQKNVPMGHVELKQGAIATSGDYERFFRYNGKKYHHVINARTGEITEGVSSVTIFAPTTVMADLLATTAMTLGVKEGIEFLNRRRNVSGFMISSAGEIFKTNPNTQEQNYALH